MTWRDVTPDGGPSGLPFRTAQTGGPVPPSDQNPEVTEGSVKSLERTAQTGGQVPLSGEVLNPRGVRSWGSGPLLG